MSEIIIPILAAIGGAAVIGAVLYGIQLYARRSKIELYVWGALVVALLSIGSGVWILGLPDGDNKQAASTIFAGGLATVGWVYSIIQLSQGAKQGRAEAAEARKQSFATQNSIAEAMVSLSENTKELSDLTEKLVLKFAPLLAASADKVQQLSDRLVESSGSYQKRKLTAELVMMHMTDVTLITHRELIMRAYPVGRAVDRNDVDKIIQDWRDPTNYKPNDWPIMHSIQVTINFFDWVASLYKNGMLDEDLCRHFKILMTRTREKFNAIVEDRRNPPGGGTNSTWQSFVEVTDQWRLDPTVR